MTDQLSEQEAGMPQSHLLILVVGANEANGGQNRGPSSEEASLLVRGKVRPDMGSWHPRKCFFFKGERKLCISP